MLYSALGSKSEITEYFTRLTPIDSERQNMSSIKLSDDEGHTKYYPTDEAAGEAHIDYVIEMDKDSDLYMYLPTKYERSCNVWVLDEEAYQNGDGMMDYAGQFFVGDNYSILNLGSFLKDETVRIRITIDNDDNEAYWIDSLFYTFDKDSFTQDAAAIQENSMTVTEFDNTYLAGECYASEEGEYLFTTIPYEDGWVVKVNGKEVKTELCAGALITVPLEKGENKITMEFEPGYYTGAIIISLAGLFIIAVIFLFEYKNGLIIIRLINRKAKSVK